MRYRDSSQDKIQSNALATVCGKHIADVKEYMNVIVKTKERKQKRYQ